MTVLEFVEKAQIFCTQLNGSITSWYRTEEHNRKVGGAKRSAHLKWLAVDIIYDVPFKRVYRQEIANSLGLKIIDEGDHDHLMPRDWGRTINGY